MSSALFGYINGGLKMRKHRKDDNLEKVCAFCEYGTLLPADAQGNTFVLCKKNGMVKDTSVCRKFSYDPLKRNPAGNKMLPELEAVDIDEL